MIHDEAEAAADAAAYIAQLEIDLARTVVERDAALALLNEVRRGYRTYIDTGHIDEIMKALRNAVVTQ